MVIEAALTIRMVFHFPLRQTEGFLRSLAQLLELELPIPDHTIAVRDKPFPLNGPFPGMTWQIRR